MLKKLKEMLQKSMEKAELFRKMIDEAKDDDEKKSRSDEFEKAMTEVKDIQGKLEKAIDEENTRQKSVNLFKTVDGLTQPADVPPADNPKPPLTGKQKSVPAEPKDQDAEDNMNEDIFFSYVSKGFEGITQAQHQHLHPESTGKKGHWSDESLTGILIPKSIKSRMFPELPQFRSKAIPMLSTDATADGGRANLFAAEYRPELLQLPPDIPSLWQRVAKKTTDVGTLQFPRLTQTDSNEFGGVAVSRNTEGQNANETELEFELETIQTYQIDAYTTASKTLLRRSRINLEAEILQKFRDAMIYTFDGEIASGTGSGEALGIVNTTGVRNVAREVANQVSWGDLVNLMFAIKDAHATAATYVISRTVHKYLMGLKDTFGRPLFTASVANGIADRLATALWFEAYHASAIGSEGDVIFGNLNNYWHVIEEDMVISRSEHAEFRKGLVAFRLEAYSGGELMQPRAFAILGDVSVS